MIHFVRRIAEWGVRPDTAPDQALCYRLTNVLLFCMCIASIFETILLFISGATQAAMMNGTAPFVFGGGLLLMKTGRTVLARVFIMVSYTTAGYAMVAALGPDTNFEYVYLFASAFGLIFFSPQEKFWRLIAIIAPLICFAMLELTHYKPIFGMHSTPPSPDKITFMRVVSAVMVWGLMGAFFAYFIRDRRKSQEQLVSSAKMVAVGRMAAGIAHEINNPLQLIVSQADRLQVLAQDGTANQIQSMAKQIQAVAMRIAEINKGLLALSRGESDEPMTEVPIYTALKLAFDVCRAHLEAMKIELRIDDFPRTLTVKGRATQLSQVLLNILNNAADALQDQIKKQIHISVNSEKGFAVISITDNGHGIKSDVVPRIFDPFFTTKPVGKGTGLGLSVSQSIVIAHGGEISFKSAATGGAQFIVRLPSGVG